MLSAGVSLVAAQNATVGDSLVVDDVRVTLLDARRLTADEYRVSGCNTPDVWPGGGFHAAFLVENRPGQVIPAVLGEVRVIVGADQYNAVTNANSPKPLAPCVVVRDLDDFYQTRYGSVSRRATPRARTESAVVEVFVRGGRIPVDADAVIELEQGGTHIAEYPSRERPLRAADVDYRWFRFFLPRH
jgi:hypothetical protein